MARSSGGKTVSVDYHFLAKDKPPIRFFKDPRPLADWVMEQAGRR